MKKKSVLIISLFLLFFCCPHAGFNSVEVKSSNSYPVHNLNTGLNYTTIQEAIDAPETENGDTIFVEEGTYHENVVVNKALSIKGQNKNGTIIDGNNATVITITSGNASINGFTIRNGGHGNILLDESYSSILLFECQNVTIENNIVMNSYCGISLGHFIGASSNNHVRDNTITSTGIAIWSIDSNCDDFFGNEIAHNIVGFTTQFSTYNTSFIENNITSNFVGLAIVLGSTIIRNNTIENNSIGVEGSGFQMEHNSIRNNEYGLLIYPGGCKMRYNTMSANRLNLGVDSEHLLELASIDIDTSNTINGRPIYFWINKSSLAVPGDAGYVAIVNSTNISIEDLSISNNGEGVLVAFSNQISLRNITTSFNGHGIKIHYSNDVVVEDCVVYNISSIGISLRGSTEIDVTNTIVKNVTTSSEKSASLEGIGILSQSSELFQELMLGGNCTFTNNTVLSCDAGMFLYLSPNNTLRNNSMIQNLFNFGVFGESIADYNNDIDTSNTVNGKTVYYWMNHRNGIVPSDAGYVALINSTSIDLKNLNLSNNLQGILLVYVNDSTLENINFHDNFVGMFSVQSHNNSIYHNNFVDNMAHVLNLDISNNKWDNGYPSGGNYWSDYNGTDANGDGIGDTPYVIDQNNQDDYPLMAPINVFYAGTWDEIEYYVDVVSNSTVSGFHFNPDEGASLRFNVTAENGTIGLCRVTIPKSLLWVENGWTIIVGGEEITDYTITSDEDYTYLYFVYSHSTKTVQITGTHVIAEFPSFLILPLFMITTLLAVIVYKRRHVLAVNRE